MTRNFPLRLDCSAPPRSTRSRATLSRMDDWTCGRCRGRNTDLYKGRRREKCTSCYLSRDKAKAAEVPQPRQGELLPQPAPNKDEGAGVLDYEWTREKAAARQLPPLAVHTTASAAPECTAAS